MQPASVTIDFGGRGVERAVGHRRDRHDALRGRRGGCAIRPRRARPGPGTRTPPAPAPDWLPRRGGSRVTRGPGANGPATVTLIGTVKPLSASCGSVESHARQRGLRPARNAASAGIAGSSSSAACAGSHGTSASAPPAAAAAAVCAIRGSRPSLIAASRGTRRRPRFRARSGSACLGTARRRDQDHRSCSSSA